jgi:outer membrane protein assembly factor BamB
LLFLAITVSLAAAATQAPGQETPSGQAHWPQFRGPGGVGVAPDGMKLPTQFGPTEKVLWKTPLPAGHSSPCIWDDRIYVTAFDKPAKKLETICLDRASGKVLWRRTAPAEKIQKVHQVNTPASSTPAADGEGVYVYFGSYGLLCYNRDGEEKWKRPLPPLEMFWGQATSPVVAGDLVLLNVSVKDTMALLAVQRRSGETVWQKERPRGTSPFAGVWSTPVVYRGPQGDEVLLAGGERLVSYHLPDGAERWWVRGLPAVSYGSPTVGGGRAFVVLTNPVGDPENLVKVPPFDELLTKYDKNNDGKLSREEIPADFDLVDRGRPDRVGNFGKLRDMMPRFDKNKDGSLDRDEWEAMLAEMAKGIESMLKISAAAVRLGGEGEVTQTHLDWQLTKGLPEVPSPLYYRGRVYLVTERAFVACHDAESGKQLYRERVGARGTCYASPVAGDGKVYVGTDAGMLVVLEAGDRFKVLARNDLKEPIVATPALVDGKIYVRTRAHLYAFGD